MRSLKIVLLATAAAGALSTAAFAADPVMMVDSPMMSPMAYSGLEGPYVGVFGLGSSTPAFGAGAAVGVNFVNDGLLFGAEGSLAVTSAAGFDGQVRGKLGVMAADSAAVFVFSGLGMSSANGTYIPVGGGVEIGLMDNISLAASGEYDWNVGGGVSPVVGKVGVNFHF